MKECIRCGAPLEEGDQICKQCGAITNVNQENVQAQNENVDTNTYEQNTISDFNDFGKTVIEPQPVKLEEPTEVKEDEEKKENIPNGTNNNRNQNKVFIMIIGILVIILIGITIFAATTMMKEKDTDEDEPKSKTSKNETSNKKDNSTKNKTIENEIEDDEDDDQNYTEKSNKNEETIEFAGYELTLPYGLQKAEYKIIKNNGEEILIFENEDEEWLASISIVEDSNFDDFKNNIDDLEEIFYSTGIAVANIENTKYYDVDTITLENVDEDEDTEKILFAIANTEENKMFEIDIYSKYFYDYVTLNYISEMFSDSRHTGKSSTTKNKNSDDTDDLDFSDLYDEIKSNSINVKEIEEKIKARQ